MREVTSEILDRVPPQNLDAEKAVLGSILIEASVLDDVAAILRPDDFYSDANRRIFAALLSMYDTDRAIDIKLLANSLHESGNLEAIGGLAYLAEVLNSVAVAAHAAYYAEIVVKASRRRKIIHAATEMLRDAWDDTREPESVLNSAEASLAAIQTSDAVGGPVPIFEAARETLERLEAARKTSSSPGLMVGLPTFDEETGGLFPGELTILAARPSVGKSSMARQFAYHVASRGKLVYFATLEMTRHEVVQLITCSQCGVSNQNLRTLRITDDEFAAFASHINDVAASAMEIRDKPGIKVADMRREARRMLSRGLSLVVVDYLQLIAPADQRVPREEQVSTMARELKNLGQELEVPVLCLCQLNRDAVKDGWPRLHHLRESGAIEQHADNVFFLHFDPNAQKRRQERERRGEQIAEGEVDDINGYLVVGKQRNASKGGYRIVWRPEITTFVPPSAVQYQEFQQYSGKDFATDGYHEFSDFN